MASPASASKGKAKATDWRLPQNKQLNEAELALLRCLFRVYPKSKDTVPIVWRGDAYHLQAMQEGVPFTAYYMRFSTAKICVTNVYGVWFKFRLCEGNFEAHQLTRRSLKLPNNPLPGIDLAELERSGEPITRAPTPAPLDKEPEANDPMPEPKQPEEEEPQIKSVFGFPL
jgi:hypothetical protein